MTLKISQFYFLFFIFHSLFIYLFVEYIAIESKNQWEQIVKNTFLLAKKSFYGFCYQ